jgi:hypothetical protein
MDDQQIIVLFGDSLLLDSVEAGLAHDEGWSVIRLRTPVPEVAARLQRLDPSLVIFDLDGVNFGSLMPFLKMKPGVPLLGLDINCSNVVALACDHYRALSLRDLKDVILRHAGVALEACEPEMPLVVSRMASCAD